MLLAVLNMLVWRLATSYHLLQSNSNDKRPSIFFLLVLCFNDLELNLRPRAIVSKKGVRTVITQIRNSSETLLSVGIYKKRIYTWTFIEKRIISNNSFKQVPCKYACHS